jgi:hypothetical protein
MVYTRNYYMYVKKTYIICNVTKKYANEHELRNNILEL